MSEESSGGPTSPRDLGLDQVCVVICNSGDNGDNGNEPPEGSSVQVSIPPHQPASVPPAPPGVVQKEKEEEEEEEEEQQDCQEQAMLPVEGETGVRVEGGGKSCTRKGSTKHQQQQQQEDRQQQQQQQQQLSATFGVTADEGDEDELPFPGFVPKTFYYFSQRHWLRFPCLRLITSPYPFRTSARSKQSYTVA